MTMFMQLQQQQHEINKQMLLQQQQKTDMLMQMFIQQQNEQKQQQQQQLQMQLLVDSLKFSIDDAAARNEKVQSDRMAEIARQDAKDKTLEALLKRYGDLLKHILTNQPDGDFNLPIYLTCVEII